MYSSIFTTVTKGVAGQESTVPATPSSFVLDKINNMLTKKSSFEIIKKEGLFNYFLLHLLSDKTHNYMRDKSFFRLIADGGICFTTIFLVLYKPIIVYDQINLMSRIVRIPHYSYNGNQCYLDVLPLKYFKDLLPPRPAPADSANSTVVNPLFFFTHGGAWGSGNNFFYYMITRNLFRTLQTGEDAFLILINYPVYPISHSSAVQSESIISAVHLLSNVHNSHLEKSFESDIKADKDEKKAELFSLYRETDDQIPVFTSATSDASFPLTYETYKTLKRTFSAVQPGSKQSPIVISGHSSGAHVSSMAVYHMYNSNNYNEDVKTNTSEERFKDTTPLTDSPEKFFPYSQSETYQAFLQKKLKNKKLVQYYRDFSVTYHNFHPLSAEQDEVEEEDVDGKEFIQDYEISEIDQRLCHFNYEFNSVDRPSQYTYAFPYRNLVTHGKSLLSLAFGAKAKINYFFNLSGPFNINNHYLYEMTRKVHEISPMKGAIQQEGFNYSSPPFLYASFRFHQAQIKQLKHNIFASESHPDFFQHPKVIHIHGTGDDTVPYEASKLYEKMLKKLNIPVDSYYPDCGHICPMLDNLLEKEQSQVRHDIETAWNKCLLELAEN